jgi:4-diphosphocytidyl-2-C-methyl-D-erythritol kinase
MIIYSHAKINIGLQILNKRMDGFHNLRSVMYPTGLCDIIEVKINSEGQEAFQFSQTGRPIHSVPEANLVTQAWRVFSKHRALPPLSIHLHKQIPVGAGLGGGSSNASSVLKAFNQLAIESLAPDLLEDLSAHLGSDCPFFLQEGPRMMEGRGDILRDTQVSLEGLYLVLLFPEIHISTAEAYAGVRPRIPEKALQTLISRPIEQWRNLIINDFEAPLGLKIPLIPELKSELYEAGAVYASLSGSGSSLFGIFRKRPRLPQKLLEYLIWEGPA